MIAESSYKKALDAIDALISAIPIGGRQDYEQALEIVEHLIDTDDENPLIDILATKIADYENSAPEYAAFNESLAAVPRELAMLRTLMDQHGLNQTDFAEEIGGRSLVNMILKGERSLTLVHMRALGKRFGLPVSAFLED